MNDIIYICKYYQILYEIEDNCYLCIGHGTLYGEYQSQIDLKYVIPAYKTLLIDLERNKWKTLNTY